jgi:hypothetical protein
MDMGKGWGRSQARASQLCSGTACTFVGVKNDFRQKRAPFVLPEPHALLKEKSYLPVHLLLDARLARLVKEVGTSWKLLNTNEIQGNWDRMIPVE